MASVDIKIPPVGESINEATIGRWNFKNGEWVEKDAVVFEIETEKATMEVTAPASGVLSAKVNQGDVVAIGSVAGSVDTSAAKPAGGATTSAPAKPAAPAPTKSSPPPSAAKPSAPAASFSGGGGLATHTAGMGPAQRKAVREGRAQAPSHSGGAGAFTDPSQTGVTRKPMSVIRKKIAERLIYSQQSTATLTTFNEVDMTQILKVRGQLKDEFLKKHNVKLGFMSFFTKAVAHAARAVPVVNAFIDGTDILYHENLHAGIAVSTERGLVVPVLRYADQLSYADIEKGIGTLAEKARVGQLGIEDMMGGTFTITNGGVFGSLLSTPILNPPQSGILGMHKTQNRPMAIEKSDGTFAMEVRPMMYVALSYDHRVIDGKDSVTFLVKVKEYLEQVSVEEVMKG
ncbi:MAG: 2-oxoglutarate dehydrogenase complex dihydrolipoyllysine-residue succinyltransferase [Bdellovibrionales bacterium]